MYSSIASPNLEDGVTLQGPLDVITVGNDTRGWGPINQLSTLAAEMFSTTLVVVPGRETVPKIFWTKSVFPRLDTKKSGKSALLIVGVPGQLYALLENPLWLGQYERVAVWVIDSFWNERIPKAVRGSKRIDWIWVTDSNDVPDWKVHFGDRVSALPWGTDALKVSREFPSTAKQVDLLRVGRQPVAYDEDAKTIIDATRLGISFAGRPGFGSDESASLANLHRALSHSKSVLAFSNLLDSTTYTHPTKEYVTGRWMDALAHGTAVAGALPQTDTARSLVPEIGEIAIDPFDRSKGLQSVAEWCQSWDETTVKGIRKFALENLDWRYRLAVIDSHFGVGSLRLKSEVVELQEASRILDSI